MGLDPLSDVCSLLKGAKRVLQFQRPQAVLNFSAHFVNPYSVLWFQLAGKPGTRFRSLSLIETDAAILTVLIPAESSIGNLLRSQVLKAPQQMIILRHLKFFA